MAEPPSATSRLRLPVPSPRARLPLPRSLVAPRTLALLACGAILLMWALGHAVEAVQAAGTAHPAFGDGPYQLFNPLRRIAAGQRGGVDFQFFHGLGVPYLHYPIFALLGGDYHAGELSRHAVTYALYLLGYPVVFAAATRRFGPTLALTTVALVLTAPLHLDPLARPFNSLMGVRTAAPLLLVGVLLLGLRPRREAVAAGALAGVALLLGTDHGVASVAMLAVVWSIRRRVGHPSGGAGWPFLAAAAFALTAGGLLLAIGGPRGAAAALRYALVEIPDDQFWYFGGAPPFLFFRSAREVLSDPPLVTAAVRAAVLAVVVAVWMRRSSDGARVGPVLLAALAYGLVGSVAYAAATTPHYLAALTRVELVVALVLAWRAVRHAAADPHLAPHLARFVPPVAAGFLLVGLLAGPTDAPRTSVLDAGRQFRTLREYATEYPKPHPGATAKTRSHLDPLIRAIDADRAANGATRPPVIWSTYAGLLEAHYGVFHPECDYIIHALGPARRAAYLAAFRRTRPDYVCTGRRAGGEYDYEEWLQQTTWGFYEELVRNYVPVAKTWAGVLWRRRPGPWRSAETAAEVRYAPPHPHGFPITRPAGVGAGDPLVVELEYEAHAPAAGVPVLGKLPRFFLAMTGTENRLIVTLPPGGRAAVLVQPTEGQEPWGWVGVESLTGGRVAVTGVRVRALPPDAAASVRGGLLPE